MEPTSPQFVTLSGWAGWPVASTRLEPLYNLDPLQREEPRAIRGNGRSYGDAAVLSGGCTSSSLPRDRFIEFDRDGGTLTAEAGLTIAEVLKVIVPAGWFLPVVPGTKFATLGGCVAADVHGKNHHLAGSFANTLEGITLRLPGRRAVVSAAQGEPALFAATCGGMGLTGYVESVKLRLQRIESDQLHTLTERFSDLDGCFAALERPDDEFTYLAAWLDGLARGKALGRGVVTRARHAAARELPRATTLHAGRPSRRRIPFPVLLSPLNSWTARVFNQVHLGRQTRSAGVGWQHYDPFFFPLDGVLDWNRLYGRRGFIQYQFVLPDAGAREGIRQVLERLAAAGQSVFLAVLKKTGAEAGPLSFPRPGYTLALDLPHRPRLLQTLDDLDDLVVKLGGRVYLAKDSRMQATKLQAMYPRLDEWRRLKREIDPESLYRSDLSHRLGLTP